LLGRASQAVDLRRTHVGAQLAVWHLAPYRERVSPRYSPRHATPPPASRSGPRTIAERVWPRRGTPSDATAAREPRRAQARSFHPRRARRHDGSRNRRGPPDQRQHDLRPHPGGPKMLRQGGRAPPTAAAKGALVNDDLNADSRQLIAAYQAELQRRPSRPTSSWKAIERRIAAGEAPVPIDDDDDVVVATRRWRWLAVPLAAASIALVSIGWKTLRQAEQRSSVVAVPFESVTRVPRGEPRLEAPQAPALSSRARVRVTLAPAALEVLAPATSEEIRSSAPSSHSTATYETRNAA